MINNSTLYISNTGSLFIKLKESQPGDNVFRLEPVRPIENEMLGHDWFDREIASGNVRQLIDLPGTLDQKE